MEPLIFERDERIYLVTPLVPANPTDEEIAAFAFGDSVQQMRRQAPNPNLAWFMGHYVEADAPNSNGAQWTGGEIAIKHLTPMFMPVTVMHDPRTAVGVIADVGLKVPDKDNVPRAKLDTALALWAHRFPEAVEEAMSNYQQGTLMQSMECFAPAYDCSVCGMTFHKQPGGKEMRDWCTHLKQSRPTGGYLNAAAGESVTAVRILRNVCFTGTGLIYGTRGAKGADPNANLAAIEDEVAEFHDRSHDRHRPRRKPSRMETIEIARSEYDRLREQASKVEQLERDLDGTRAEHDKATAERDEAKKAAEQAEAEKAQASERAEQAEQKVAQAEEKAAQEQLRTERFEKLGDGFKGKLGEVTKRNLTEQAATMSDEEWSARVDEVAELVGVKPDEAASEEPAAGETFSREEAARAGAGVLQGDTPAEGAQPLGTVVGGLFKRTTNKS